MASKSTHLNIIRALTIGQAPRQGKHNRAFGLPVGAAARS